MNKHMKIGLAAAVVVVLLLAAWYLKRTDTSTTPNAVQGVEEVLADKTFETKTAAYDALVNEKEIFYNRPAAAFKPQPAEVVLEPSEPAKVAQPSTPAPTKQFDEAYQAVEQNVRSMYGENPPAANTSTHATPSEAPAVPLTAEERRRKAMLQDWGMERGHKTAGDADPSSTIRAVIHGTQLVRVGQPALFRTKEPIRYGTLEVPANTLLSGVAGVSDNRLSIKISSVRMNNEIFTLPLEVYGSDGMPGIPLNYDQAEQIADRQVSQTALQEASSAMGQYGGTIGRIAGSVASGIGNQVRSSKNIEVKLIDNQSVILKIVKL